MSRQTSSVVATVPNNIFITSQIQYLKRGSGNKRGNRRTQVVNFDQATVHQSEPVQLTQLPRSPHAGPEPRTDGLISKPRARHACAGKHWVPPTGGGCLADAKLFSAALDACDGCWVFCFGGLGECKESVKPMGPAWIARLEKYVTRGAGVSKIAVFDLSPSLTTHVERQVFRDRFLSNRTRLARLSGGGR